MRTLIYSFVILLSTSAAYAQQQCYWPNSDRTDAVVPCNESAEHSHCCGKTDTCLSNGYCWQQSDYVYPGVFGPYANRMARGGCIDPNWGDACPQYCKDVNSETSTSLFLAYDDNNGTFCCGANYNSTINACKEPTLSSGYTPFNLYEPGKVIIDRTDRSTTLNTTNTISSSNATTISTATVTVTSKADPSITTIAAGIAVPLGVLLIAAVASTGILFHQRKRLQKQLSGQQQALLQSQHSRHQSSLQPTYSQSQYGYGAAGDVPLQTYKHGYVSPPPLHELHTRYTSELGTERQAVEVSAGSPTGKP